VTGRDPPPDELDVPVEEIVRLRPPPAGWRMREVDGEPVYESNNGLLVMIAAYLDAGARWWSLAIWRRDDRPPTPVDLDRVATAFVVPRRPDAVLELSDPNDGGVARVHVCMEGERAPDPSPGSGTN
jgi:hypothetical protein